MFDWYFVEALVALGLVGEEEREKVKSQLEGANWKLTRKGDEEGEVFLFSGGTFSPEEGLSGAGVGE